MKLKDQIVINKLRIIWFYVWVMPETEEESSFLVVVRRHKLSFNEFNYWNYLKIVMSSLSGTHGILIWRYYLISWKLMRMNGNFDLIKSSVKVSTEN